MLVIVRLLRSQRLFEKAFWQDNLRAIARTERAGVAAANAIETVAGSDDPRVARRTPQIPAEIFEDGRELWWNRGKIVKSFIDTCCQASSGDVVSQNAAIFNPRKECALRKKFLEKMRNVLLTLRPECFFVAAASAECYNDCPSIGALWAGHRRRHGNTK